MPEQDHNKTPQSTLSWISRHHPISLTEKIFFMQNLQVMVRTGLSLAMALRTLADQSTHKRFKYVLHNVYEQVEKGTPFARALSMHPSVFPDLTVSMIESGELSGKLDEVLQHVTEQMKKDHELISKVRGAMLYPSIIVIAMGGIGTAMMVFVIPKLLTIFTEFNTELPLPTRVLIAASNFTTRHGLLLALLAILLIAGARYGIKKTERGKQFFHGLLLRLPLFGGIIKKVNLARISRTFSSLLTTDIPIVQTALITSKTIANIHYRAALIDLSEKLKKGAPVSQVLSAYPHLFPPVVSQLARVGEESGSLDHVLGELASFYEEDVDQIMKNLPSIIEPLLILILGAGVGAMAVAIIMPMYSLTQTI